MARYTDTGLDTPARLACANRFLRDIGVKGPRLFSAPDLGRTATFEIDESGQLWWKDPVSRCRVFMHPRHPWVNFPYNHHLRALIHGLRGFILLGYKLDPNFFRPTLDNGRLHPWGFSEHMDYIREAGQRQQVIAKPRR